MVIENLHLIIVTVCFNDLAGLKRTFESLVTQDSYSFHWLVSDGGSDDGSMKYIDSLDIPFSYEVHSSKDGGIYEGMNKAIDFLHSEFDGYVLFLNSGDELASSNIVNNFSKYRSESEVALCYGGATIIHPELGAYNVSPRWPSRIKYGMPTSHQAMFFSAKFLRLNKYNLSYRLGGDYDLVCRAYVYGLVKVLPFVVCKFHLDGVSVDKRAQALLENERTRLNVLKMNYFQAKFLYFLHYLHMNLKKVSPGLMAWLRRAV